MLAAGLDEQESGCSWPSSSSGRSRRLDAALQRAGLAMHPTNGDRRLVEAEPEVVADVAMAAGVVLHRLAPAEDAGLERLFFELTASGASAPSPTTDSIHPVGARRHRARALDAAALLIGTWRITRREDVA